MATVTGQGPEISGAQAGTRPENVLDVDSRASSDDGVHEKAPPVVVSKRQKVKQHFRRFWWIYVIAVVILLAILLPILFKVIIPAIIKNVVDDQELPVRSGALNFTSPTHLHMSMDTSLDTPLGVKIDPLPLKMYQTQDHVDGDGENKDAQTPFLTLQMPEQHIHHETNVTIPDQILEVGDYTQLVGWFNEFFDKEYAPLRIRGDDLSAHLGALHYTVDLDKTILVPGLNYLHGFGIQEMEFTIPPDPSGFNMRGVLNIPNAGVITLGLGNVSFNVLAGDVNLGLVHIYNLDLKPGNNTPPFEGVFYFDQLIPNLSAILESQRESLADGGTLLLHTAGNSTFHKGQRIKYIEDVLNRKRIPFRIPAMTFLLDVVSGLLAGGGANGTTQMPLLDTVADVLGNRTLFEGMLDHFETAGSGRSNGGSNGGATNSVGNSVRRMVTRAVGRSMGANLLRLGLRGGLAKF
ncbi:hypothetical protein VTK26DRAFT_2935 [Humicola hyalothermophila]